MSTLPLSMLLITDSHISGDLMNPNRSRLVAVSALGAIVQKPENDRTARYYNPFTFREETERELWASLGNWDL